MTDWVEGATCLQEALISSSCMGRNVHSLILSIQHFLCQPRRRPSSKVPRRMVMERLSWRVACPNHANFRLLTAARRGSCGPTLNLVLPLAQSLVLCSEIGDAEKCLRAPGADPGGQRLNRSRRDRISQPERERGKEETSQRP